MTKEQEAVERVRRWFEETLDEERSWFVPDSLLLVEQTLRNQLERAKTWSDDLASGVRTNKEAFWTNLVRLNDRLAEHARDGGQWLRENVAQLREDVIQDAKSVGVKLSLGLGGAGLLAGALALLWLGGRR